MRIRLDSHSGAEVPAPEQAVDQIRALLTEQQKRWAEQLAQQPESFAQLEPQVHQTFQQCADRLVASLLAQATAQPSVRPAAKKK